MPEISRNRQNARYAEDAVSVKDFGAVGDGVTDDSSAIQDAIDSLGANGGEIYVPEGRYVINTGITVLNTTLHLILYFILPLSAVKVGQPDLQHILQAKEHL